MDYESPCCIEACDWIQSALCHTNSPRIQPRNSTTTGAAIKMAFAEFLFSQIYLCATPEKKFANDLCAVNE